MSGRTILAAVKEGAAHVYRLVVAATKAERALQDTLDELSGVIADQFDFRRVLVARYGFAEEMLAEVGATGVAADRRDFAAALLEGCLLDREHQAVVFVSDVRVPAPGLASRFGLSSVVVLPLATSDTPLGFVAADRGGVPFALDEELRDELEGFSVLIAALLEQALVTEEMRQLARVKDDFVALAAHELRTPAAVIYGITATLHERGSSLEEHQRVELRATLHAQSSRLKQLVDQLLDVSRLDARAVTIERNRVAVRRRVEELVLLVGEKRADEVEIEIDERLETDIDRIALDRIVSNLVANALRYGAPPVKVRAEQLDRHFRLSVADSGTGVAPDLLPRLFDRFSRGVVGDGSGLGLSIAREYARAHGGDLLYTPPAQGAGACFELVVPVEQR